MNELTISAIERQNVLNNRFAIDELQRLLHVEGILWDNKYWFTKKMVADFYEVNPSTIDRCLNTYGEELKGNGYFLSSGNHLKTMKLHFGHLINEATKTTRLGLFDFRALLNIGMLLTESAKAKKVRSIILDTVIAVLNNKTGGGTKYINRRDINYISAAISEENYRKNFTKAIGQYVESSSNYKYEQITDFIYRAIFRENAREYRQILRLEHTDNILHTLYAEVLLVISSFENGVSARIYEQYQANGQHKLSIEEVKAIVEQLANDPMQIPYINDARTKMASRDLSFREAYHDNIAEYLQATTPEEFERFIGEQSIDFDRILMNNKDVLKRLKQADNE